MIYLLFHLWIIWFLIVWIRIVYYRLGTLILRRKARRIERETRLIESIFRKEE